MGCRSMVNSPSGPVRALFDGLAGRHNVNYQWDDFEFWQNREGDETQPKYLRDAINHLFF